MWDAAREVIGWFPEVMAAFSHPLLLAFVALFVAGKAFALLSRLVRHGAAEVGLGVKHVRQERAYQRALAHPGKMVAGTYLGVRYLGPPAGWSKSEWSVYQYAKSRGDSLWKRLRKKA